VPIAPSQRCTVAASLQPVSSAVIDYRGTFRFSVSPRVVWDALERTGEFDHWWAWLSEFHLTGAGLQSGSVLTGVVSPPVPYQMRVRVELEDCVRPCSIEAAVHGDLEGHASLRLLPQLSPELSSGEGEASATIVSVDWTIEMMQRPMRIAARVAYPLLRWGHDRVVDSTVSGFRRQIEDPR